MLSRLRAAGDCSCRERPAGGFGVDRAETAANRQGYASRGERNPGRVGPPSRGMVRSGHRRGSRFLPRTVEPNAREDPQHFRSIRIKQSEKMGALSPLGGWRSREPWSDSASLPRSIEDPAGGAGWIGARDIGPDFAVSIRVRFWPGIFAGEQAERVG
jgi:hypothetical protein